MQTQLETPLLFIVFNRPDVTQYVFDKIREMKPKYLFVSADGPRNESESKICEEVRKIVKKIDWDCEVKYKFEDKNLGCKIGVSSAINWFFDNVERGIILEDDCLPNDDFFRFCEDLLETYKNNEKIMHITGDNFQFNKKRGYAHYYFSIYNHCWGWATWKRAWKHFDVKMENFSDFKKQNKLQNSLNKNEYKYWMNIFQKVYDGEVDSWAYIWTYTCWSQGGLTCTPNVNLVSNIGFDERATHTKNKTNKAASLLTKKMKFPLKHPKIIKINRKADLYTSKNIFGIQKYPMLINVLKSILKKLKLFTFFKNLYLKLKK